MKSKSDPNAFFKLKKWLLGIYLLLITIITICLIYKVWPQIDTAVTDSKTWINTVSLWKLTFTISDDLRLILLVILTGALGSCVHAATSFSSYVGNRNLKLSWAWWYILRPFIGMSLALIFYFVIRGGFLSTNTDASDVSPYGIAAVAGLVGMFSKQATDKLKELFDNLFRTTNGDDQRSDKLVEMQPVSKFMIAIHDIVGYKKPENTCDKEIKITDLTSLIEGNITRIPIFSETNVVLYVIHQSLLYKYISFMKIDKESNFDVNTATLKDFLEYKNMRELTTSIAYVSEDDTLEDAKQAMEEIANCQDVFITETGKENEPVKGWLMNVDISKHRKN